MSDSTGTVFTESLRRHFYPNHATITDFFRILSIPGTFLATQMNPDTTLRTVITHDRGATWRPLPVPEGLSCDQTSRSTMIGEQAGVASSGSAASSERLEALARDNSSEPYEPVSTRMLVKVSYFKLVPAISRLTFGWLCAMVLVKPTSQEEV